MHFHYDTSSVPATSVPFFDASCGSPFSCLADFEAALDGFLAGMVSEAYDPRGYVEKNLLLEICGRNYIALIDKHS